MGYTKRIVCLANSKKLGERCVAGLEVTGTKLGKWIRPVSSREGEALSLQDRCYADGNDVQLLDIVDVPMLKAKPHSCQMENHLIDEERHWSKVGTLNSEKLLRHANDDSILWADDGSSGNGSRDRLREAVANRMLHSLELVHPGALVIRVIDAYQGRKQVRAAFELGGNYFDLGVTDLDVKNGYISKAFGDYKWRKDAVACISLGEPYKGYRYKLVASIINVE